MLGSQIHFIIPFFGGTGRGGGISAYCDILTSKELIMFRHDLGYSAVNVISFLLHLS